jgi:hypothetical protein
MSLSRHAQPDFVGGIIVGLALAVCVWWVLQYLAGCVGG